jgi:hypothetical protein
LVTVSSKVSASLNSSTMRGLAGCNFDLRRQGGQGVAMLAQQSLEGEDAGAAALAGSGRPAHAGEGPRAGLDRGSDLAVVDDLTVADDHWIPSSPTN